jgi:hypothetical protein
MVAATEWIHDQMIPAIDTFIGAIPEDDVE